MTPSGSYVNAVCLVLRNSWGIAHRLVGQDAPALARDPVQGVDRRQHLHRERLVAGLALLGNEQVADLVGLVDQHLAGTLQVAGTVAQGELRPEWLHLGDLGDDRRDVVGRGHGSRLRAGRRWRG